MNFREAVKECSMGCAILRMEDPSKTYWKTEYKSLEERVPVKDQLYTDWVVYDPTKGVCDAGDVFEST